MGNYETETLETSALLEEGEDVNQAFTDLRAWVLEKLDIPNLRKSPQELIEDEMKEF